MRSSIVCSALLRFSCVAASLTPFVSLHAEEEPKAETVVAVSVAKVVRTTLHFYVTAYGTVDTAPVSGPNQSAGGARLAAGASGLVVTVPGIEGSRVERGAVMVQLDPRAADAAVVRAQAAVSAAEKTFARQIQLQAADGTSQRLLQEAEERLAAARGELAATELQQSQLAIRAPLSGTLARLQVKPGEWLNAGQEVGEIVDLGRLTVSMQIPASESGGVQLGQSAKVFVRLGATEKPVAEGTVNFISPQISAGADSVTVRLALPQQSNIRPGQFVAVRIVTSTHESRLAVPRESVYTDHDGQSTLSIVEGEVAKQKVVKIGLHDGPLVEVEGDGVTEGASVVTLGSYALPKETKVRVLTGTTEAAK